MSARIICKPSIKRFIIPLQKDFVILASLFWYDINNTENQWNAFVRIRSVVNRLKHYSVLRCYILRVLLTSFGEMT